MTTPHARTFSALANSTKSSSNYGLLYYLQSVILIIVLYCVCTVFRRNRFSVCGYHSHLLGKPLFFSVFIVYYCYFGLWAAKL